MDEKTLDRVIALLQPDARRVATAKARQAAVWRNQPADYLPLCFSAPVPERQQFALEFDMVAEFEQADVMLYKGLWDMIGVERSCSDSVASIRPNFGTGLVPTMFGLKQTVLPHVLPWMKNHLSKEQIERFEVPNDVSQLGMMPETIRRMKYFRQRLGGRGCTYLGDTQSPFDIAHLVRGDDIFTDLYDDPPFVHHLLELTTKMYIAASKLMKEVSGEPLDGGCHGNSVWMEGGGVRACEDSSTLLSPALVEEFVIPYLQRVLEAFGGGWVHYCGNNQRLLDAVIDDIPAVRGLNFGNPERHDQDAVMRRLLDKGKFYVGVWLRKEGEDDRAYFTRMLRPLCGEKRGFILQTWLDASTPDKARAAMELWHELQD